MPLNILRLNQRHQHPTERIVFIKANPGEDAPIAEEFLNRVAAICHPVLKNNHLSVTTLEDFPPNKEFLGRNFNNGECIQLVLKSQNGSWLSFRSVVMVMMHELAHNLQMNHSRAFWKVRNQFAGEMQELWSKGYTGEGIWGPGREVETGIRVGGGRDADTEMPEHLCGGTYRSRRRKRMRGTKLTWKEQKERRIAKKFGVNGQALGEDVVERSSLQGFKGPTTKSRVAGSKRARELRAAAALARFDKTKSEPVKDETPEAEDEEDPRSDDDYEDVDASLEDAEDIDGTKLVDGKGQNMVRVCEDEETDDVQVQAEMNELINLEDIPVHKPKRANSVDRDKNKAKYEREAESHAEYQANEASSLPSTLAISTGEISDPGEHRHSLHIDSQTPPKPSSCANEAKIDQDSKTHLSTKASDTIVIASKSKKAEQICSICSMSNEPAVLLCAACSNVLDESKCPGSWTCNSSTCGPGYLNPADFGVCGICGGRRG